VAGALEVEDLLYGLFVGSNRSIILTTANATVDVDYVIAVLHSSLMLG
jgi:hypothetical protein